MIVKIKVVEMGTSVKLLREHVRQEYPNLPRATQEVIVKAKRLIAKSESFGDWTIDKQRKRTL
jgi:hypothetical protein